MSRQPETVAPREQGGAEPACDVFYLRTELHGGGFRWVVVKFGAIEPVLVGESIFPSDYAAKISGRADLERYLAAQNRWDPLRERP